MKLSAISDVHVKNPHDDADKLLMEFLNHPEVNQSDYILLLGDIFDLMVGPHEVYLKLYHHLFAKMTELQKSGKKIFFFEGNHDVHLERLFKKIWKNGEVFIGQDPLVENIDGKSYYFSHGDEHEYDNHSYHRYIKFIRSRPLKFVADYIMPYRVIKFAGEKASQLSRKKGSKKYDAEKVRTKFREGVLKTTNGKYDFVLGGHSHVQDLYTLPGTDTTYMNNGYALRTNTFIVIENHIPRFVPLR